MTEKELSGLYFLNREIKWLQDELDEMEQGIGVKSAVPSHGPKSRRRFGSNSPAVEIADLKAILQLNKLKIQREQARLERYIGNIECPETRLIFRLRHIDGMTWREIADEVHMDFTTAYRKHKQYLENATNAT